MIKETSEIFMYYFLYVRKDSIMLSEQTMFFPPIELKKILGISHLLNYEMTNNLCLSLCDSVTVLCV